METRSTPKPTTHTFPKNPLEFYIAKEAARYGHKKTPLPFIKAGFCAGSERT